ncbi:hypothetical protein [Lacticaseibacillus porcinae]|uniref:hypothetical protein n=1 Tax=Lacticaseibacillus porcinae TaxID=1123687 RepID=UPI000F7A83E5|nr:hypothetical protein [Lacticaseibacillus porcinae]
MTVNLITDPADLDFANQMQRAFIGAEIKAFRRWLKTSDHPQRTDWSQQVRQLEHSIKAFGDRKLTYYQLLQQFIAHFEGGSDRQIHRLKVRVALANEIRDHYDKAINSRLPVAILVINIKNVEHYMYSNARDIQFNTDQEDAALRKTDDLLRVMFLRVNQQKAQFERDHMPFYDPQWLATQQARNQPIWYPEQLDHYHLKF